jgi:hypothetical protein
MVIDIELGGDCDGSIPAIVIKRSLELLDAEVTSEQD